MTDHGLQFSGWLIYKPWYRKILCKVGRHRWSFVKDYKAGWFPGTFILGEECIYCNRRKP